MDILITVLSISGISAGLALIIVIAEKYLNNYGRCTIKINDDREIVVEGGDSLLSSLSEEKIFIPSACGGKATCGYCKVKILEGEKPVLPTEEPYLTGEEKKDGIRLSCQIKVKNDLSVYIPEELFNIKQYTAVVSEIEDLTHDIKSFVFKLNDPENIIFKAGQYVQIDSKPYGKVRESVSRAYSISSAPFERQTIELIVKLVPDGLCTTFMHEHLREGDKVTLSGPYGDFYIRDGDEEIIFIAGGSGLAPVKSMVADELEKGSRRKMVFFFGAVTEKDIFHMDFFKKLQAESPNFTFIPAVSRPQGSWHGEKGLVTEAVERYLNDDIERQAYLCGSPGMINAGIELLKRKGMREENIFYDKF